MGSQLRVENKEQLEDFLERDDAQRIVKAASFEEVFFAVLAVGLADSLDLLPMVTGRQVRGFIDLDCWRKDQFVRKPFMEWIAAFIQSGSEDTAKALSGIDEYVLALFLKDVVHVYEVDRDDPPENTQMILTPDSRFGVEPVETDEGTTIGMLILDALFKYNPHLGSRILTLVRYTTRLELEETAYDNKVRRLEVHGFVDYYEAMSIYASPSPGESLSKTEVKVEEIPGEETPGRLPQMFADSLSGARFLVKVLESVTDPEESERIAQELTALSNRILSANLVDFGELNGVRPALEEMRDTLTIGLEYATGGQLERASEVLRKSYVQTLFKVGFGQIAGLRTQADVLTGISGFRMEMLDPEDRDFVDALRRFKPLLIENGQYRGFRSITDVEKAQSRLHALIAMVRTFLPQFPSVPTTFARAFNTATIRAVLYGRFEIVPLTPAELKGLEAWLADGFALPTIDVPSEFKPFAEKWWAELRSELEPLVGKKIDARFVHVIQVKL
jgi:hypothetical protein